MLNLDEPGSKTTLAISAAWMDGGGWRDAGMQGGGWVRCGREGGREKKQAAAAAAATLGL